MKNFLQTLASFLSRLRADNAEEQSLGQVVDAHDLQFRQQAQERARP